MDRSSSSPWLTASYLLLIVRSKLKNMSSSKTFVYLPRWLLKPLTTSSVCQPADLPSSHPAPTSFPKLEPSSHPPASPPGKPAERVLDFFSAGKPLNDLSCSLTSLSPEEGNMEMPLILRPSRGNLFQPPLRNSSGFSILPVRTYLSTCLTQLKLAALKDWVEDGRRYYLHLYLGPEVLERLEFRTEQYVSYSLHNQMTGYVIKNSLKSGLASLVTEYQDQNKAAIKRISCVNGCIELVD